MTDEKKRRNAGFIGSVLIHILIVLVISFTGLLHFSSNTEDIVEVTFFGGGGGGGNGVEAAIVMMELLMKKVLLLKNSTR